MAKKTVRPASPLLLGPRAFVGAGTDVEGRDDRLAIPADERAQQPGRQAALALLAHQRHPGEAARIGQPPAQGEQGGAVLRQQGRRQRQQLHRQPAGQFAPNLLRRAEDAAGGDGGGALPVQPVDQPFGPHPRRLDLVVHDDPAVIPGGKAAILQPPADLHILIRQQQPAEAAEPVGKAAHVEQRLALHDHVDAIGFEPARHLGGAELTPAFPFDDREHAAQAVGPPGGQGGFPDRQDPAADDAWPGLALGHYLPDPLDPIRRRQAIIVDIGNEIGMAGFGPAVAGGAGAGPVDPQQLGVRHLGDHGGQLGADLRPAAAVDHDHVEPAEAHRLLTEARQA